MRIYFAVTAEEYPAALSMLQAAGPGQTAPALVQNPAKPGQNFTNFAYVAYRIGGQSDLLRGNVPLQTRGGLLSLSDTGAAEIRQPEILSGAVIRECGRRGCTGAVLDFESAPREDLWHFVSVLSRQMRENNRRLYVPRPYADAAPEAVRLINTAVSGGNFREYLREEVEKAGNPDKIALDIQRLRMDFRLPAPTGEGNPLSAEEFTALSDGKAVFFSPDLCARYFTFTEQHAARSSPDGQYTQAQTGAAHFVLFDDADTLNMKLRIGAEMNIQTAFFQWPEVHDIAPDLRPE